MPGFNGAERLSLYAHLRTLESDFDKSQSQLRTIAAAWSGGIIGALALTTVAIATTGLSSNRPAAEEIAAAKELLFYVRQVICIAGSLGIYAFWYVDQSVYQRLLHSAFAYGLNLEFENPDLPQVRSSIYWANLDITGRLGMFYRMQFWSFIILGWAFILIPQDWSLRVSFCAMIIVALIVTIGAMILESRSWRWASLKKTIDRLYPATLAAGLPPPGIDESDPIASAWLTRIRSRPVPPTTP
jgi:hypothetical protein